ncbi:helix-turn-helix domain-containing protein [Ottowia thiooxydans]|uniref:helix-turn-helix domain-containing protein n=1 Tax=Ottowia thiooxydans TaxID=219182 RepID=UPI0004911A2B|nr:helix-turn-helix domain-containing protein [Ottowia thiooxydans]
MSIAILNQCWPMKMPPTAKSVLIALADQANDDGHCWPSIETIAERTCLHRATVIEALQWLELARAVDANRANGRKTTYRVTPGFFDATVPFKSRRSTSRAERQVEDQNQSGKPTGRAERPVGQNDLTSRAERPHPSGKTTGPVGQNDTNHQEPPINHQEPPVLKNSRSRKSNAGLPDGFPEFWDQYPRKVDKSDAAKSWSKKLLHEDLDLRAEVMVALAQQKKSDQWAKDAGKFIPHPTTWLNKERWTSNIGAPGSDAGSSAGNWWSAAGFPNVYEAENERCYQHNAHEFREGKRLPAKAVELA